MPKKTKEQKLEDKLAKIESEIKPASGNELLDLLWKSIPSACKVDLIVAMLKRGIWNKP